MLPSGRFINHLSKKVCTANTTTVLSNPQKYSQITQRNYPGEFEIVDLKNPVKGGSGANAPKHESFHRNLKHVGTGKYYGVLTSKSHNKGTPHHFVSSEKLDGTVATKPHDGQYLGLYNFPKTVSDPSIEKKRPEYQPYVDKYENDFKKIVKSKENTVCEDRTSKEDSRFYNEDGTRDNENFPLK